MSLDLCLNDGDLNAILLKEVEILSKYRCKLNCRKKLYEARKALGENYVNKFIEINKKLSNNGINGEEEYKILLELDNVNSEIKETGETGVIDINGNFTNFDLEECDEIDCF